MPNWRWLRGRVVEPQTLTIPGLGAGRYPSRAVPAVPVPGLTIAEENALPGNDASEWDITGAGDSTNLGFAREFSVTAGETINFSCDGTGTDLDIYRIGWYGGDGWRLIDSLTNAATDQPTPAAISSSNGAGTCTAWTTTASWAVPEDATSGLYVGVYRNLAANNASYIPFVVRRDDRTADIMVKTSDATWALAYNYYGTPDTPFTGDSVYGSGGPIGGSGGIENRVHAATYHRPIITRQGIPQTYWLNAEAPLIRYLERMGFDVTYSACRDWRDGGSSLANANIYISSGHDEYWSQEMRDAWETKRDAGKHLLFMSGNEVFWRIRYETDGNMMWCFKDTMPGPGGHTAGTTLDPVSWTGTWKDTRWVGRQPENEITGTDFRLNGPAAIQMVVTDPYADHQFWRHTTVGTSGFTSGAGIIGFEADEALATQEEDSVTYLAQTTFDATDLYADDNGQVYTGDKTDFDWRIVAQRYVSGAVVVGFGSCQWAWGLDATHDRGSNIADSRIQQATMNLLYDLGATAETPISGLTTPTPASLDNYGLIPAPIMPIPPLPIAA